jgi:hypothetical protein
MRRGAVLATICALALPATAQATSSWLPVAPMSQAGADASEPAIAMAPDGTVIALWTRGAELQASVRPPGGPFSAPAHVAGGSHLAASADVAVDAQGNAVAVWFESEASSHRVFRAFRPAGGSFSEGKAISPADIYAQNPKVAVSPAGDAVAAWQGAGLGVALRSAGGDFGEPQQLGDADAGSGGFDAALDAAGNALLVWARNVTGSASIESASAPVGGPFGDVKKVAGPVDHAADPDLALDAAGNAVVGFVLWDPFITDTTKWRPFTASRPAGGDFAAAEPLSASTRESERVQAGFNPQGEAIVTFMQGFQPWGAVRPPGGAFGDAIRLSPAAHDSGPPVFAVDGTGRAQVLWLGTDGTGDKLHFVTRPPGGAFSGMQTLSDSLGVRELSEHVVADPEGNAVAIWQRKEGDEQRIELAGYDGAPPRITGVVAPASAPPGATVAFSASVTDVWSPFSAGWEFGDGAAATGIEASHAFAAPGTFTPRITATDDLGNAASASSTITIAIVAALAVADVTAPSLSALALVPTRFRAASRGASVASRVGAALRFRLSERGTVRFRAQRAAKGRRVRGACRRATAKNRRRPRCTRFASVRGSFVVPGNAGANQVRFRGRIGGRRLRPGLYRLVANATDPAGNVSKAVRASFRIVRR